MRRRLFALAVAPLLLRPSVPARAAADPRRLALRHASTGARFSGIWHNGAAPDRVALADLSFMLADSTTEPPKPFDPDAIALLWDLVQRTGLPGEIVVRSGYRTPTVNIAVHGAGDSFHLRAAALDIEPGSGRLAGFGEAALAMGRGGVGLYPSRGFVHVDTGPVRRWGEDGTGLPIAREDRIGRVARAWAEVNGLGPNGLRSHGMTVWNGPGITLGNPALRPDRWRR
jgi:uncharacterized protein YcbK (DUF882 family)